MATVKYPIRYDLSTTQLAEGEQWVWLDLVNVSDEPITDLTVRLISHDSSRIAVEEPDNHLLLLAPGQAEEIGFELRVAASTDVHIAIDGEQDGAPFRWESPAVQLHVGAAPAKIARVATTAPAHPPAGEPLELEATARSVGRAENLRLELWVHTPDGAFKKLDVIPTGNLHSGDVCRYSITFSPGEKGTHTVHAYLYDADRRIDRHIQPIYVS